MTRDPQWPKLNPFASTTPGKGGLTEKRQTPYASGPPLPKLKLNGDPRQTFDEAQFLNTLKLLSALEHAYYKTQADPAWERMLKALLRRILPQQGQTTPLTSPQPGLQSANPTQGATASATGTPVPVAAAVPAQQVADGVVKWVQGVLDTLQGEMMQIYSSFEVETLQVLLKQSPESIRIKEINHLLYNILKQSQQLQHPAPIEAVYALLLKALPLHVAPHLWWTYQPDDGESPTQAKGESDLPNLVLMIQTQTMQQFKIQVSLKHQTKLHIEVEYDRAAESAWPIIERTCRKQLVALGFPTPIIQGYPVASPAPKHQKTQEPESSTGAAQTIQPKPVAMQPLQGGSVVLVAVANAMAEVILERDQKNLLWQQRKKATFGRI